ncbi:MAG: flagellin [Phycisphaerales bacterium]
MARINTNIPSLIAQSNLTRSNQELEVRLERLSTGLRINRGKDDPAGLIISERIGTDLAGIDQAIKNSERASSVIATTEGALSEISDLLNSIKGLMVQSANSGAISDEEIAANQNQIDSAIESITRISNTATFGGLRLLDGSLDYVTSGLVNNEIRTASILGASFVGSNSLQVDVDVIASAQKGALYLNGDNPGAAPDGVLLSSTTLQIAGRLGVVEVTISSGRPLSELVTAVNSRSSQTGVQAALINGDANSGIVFRSVDYGSDAFVSVKRVGGPPDPADSPFAIYKFDGNADLPDISAGFPWSGIGTSLVAATRDEGRDVQALINGSLATGDGLNVSLNETNLSVELLLDETFATTPAGAASTFHITGGGALFQLGQDITALQQSNIGIGSMSASNLGGSYINGAVQYLSSLKFGQTNSLENSADQKDFTAASEILEKAIDEVATLRGRLGAFERNVLETNVRSLQSQFENLTASRSQIVDADFAEETSKLTRAQILQAAGTSVLQLANQQAQSVLQLLG